VTKLLVLGSGLGLGNKKTFKITGYRPRFHGIIGFAFFSKHQFLKQNLMAE
jgi:hypothetical protein